MPASSVSGRAPRRRVGIAYLDGRRLSRGLDMGIRRLIADQDRLNRINVFPVPDGDTGTNLALTMAAVRQVLDGSTDRRAGPTLESVADAALDGARGNSGAILAQFFLGLGDACADLSRLAVDEFVAGVRAGADYAREALSNPRDGTILTVLREFADELGREAGRTVDFTDLLDAGLRRSQQALAATRDQLEELRRADVVDAGAQGFVDLLEGIVAYIREGATATAAAGDAPISEEAFPDLADDEDLEHRYCTECMITGDGIDRRMLREALTPLGSSLVVAGTQRKVRVHVHVDNPDRVFALAATYGEVSSRKADDMRQQQGAARGGAGRIAVVIDSAGDVPEAEFERLGLHLVPIRIHFGDSSYLDKVSLSSDAFYEELATNPQHPKTSQPAPGDFRRLYQFLASHHPAVVSIHISKQVSGTFQAAATAASRVNAEGGRILAIDSRSASLGQGLIAMEAAELAQAGCDVEDIVARVEDSISRTRTWCMLGDVGYAVRGGRVPRHRQVIADLLRLTPLIRTYADGRIASAGALFGRRRLVERFAGRIASAAQPGASYRVAVAHASDRDRAERLLALLLERLPTVQAHYLTELGSALGVHGGPGTLVVSLQQVVADR